jgi:hypothetical protein
MPRIELERIERAEDADDVSSESFDRVAFAEAAVALVKPPRMRVAICGGARKVHVSSGRQWGAAPGMRWAMLAVPANASRRAIASAVLALHDGDSRPWALDVLVASAGIYR